MDFRRCASGSMQGVLRKACVWRLGALPLHRAQTINECLRTASCWDSTISLCTFDNDLAPARTKMPFGLGGVHLAATSLIAAIRFLMAQALRSKD
eukprot:9641605-Alexandrium_andersonii.AAC.1